jgi:hypothetical protein
MANKLENLMDFSDFEKTWSAKNQKSTKRTEVGLDVLNEHLYMKVMNQESPSWEENVKKFVSSVEKAIDDNQAKSIEIDGTSATFTIRGRKHKVSKGNGSMTLWRTKAEKFRTTTTDSAGRVREEKKRQKKVEEVEVKIPIGKSEASNIYDKLKDIADD